MLIDIYYDTIKLQERKNIEKEFGIEIEGKRKALIGTMCNLGEGIKEEALVEGRIIGRTEGEYRKLISLIIKKIQKNKELNQIADELEESDEVIRPLYESVLKEAPEYDLDKIYECVMDKIPDAIK